MEAFDRVLDGRCCELELGGERVTLQVERWARSVDAVDRMVLDRCRGPTLDVGCGPGRMTGALLSRGVPSVGIDTSRRAVRLTAERGGLAMRRSVFESIPGEGRWRHVLLADGNLGIGGNPEVLLRRTVELLEPGGSAMVELEPPGKGVRSGIAHLSGGMRFRWSLVGADAIETLATSASMAVTWLDERDGRWFAELVPRVA